MALCRPSDHDVREDRGEEERGRGEEERGRGGEADGGGKGEREEW